MSKITKIGNRGIALIKESETFVPHPYKCPAGVWTIGWGTTFYFDTKKKVTEHDPPITEAEADRLLRGHIDTIFAPLADKLCRDDLSQNQFDAVVDFLYNCGATYIDKRGKLQYYNLFHNINIYMNKMELMAYWRNLCIKANGRVLNGLIARRNKEVELFFT
jgi:lysozyme